MISKNHKRSGSERSGPAPGARTQSKTPPAATEPPHEIHLPRTRVTISRDEILQDYALGYRSRLASLVGRKEVLTGKAKFGIFGDGKELPQLAMAKAFANGDFRAGYYRDQTFMLATGMTTLDAFFAQLYADTDPAHEPASAGRMMNAHFATRLVDEQGQFVKAIDRKNSSADISPTAGQMARALGLAYASKLYRQESALKSHSSAFSRNGSEIAFATIGDASTSEGIFFETVNAAGVLQVPLVTSVWDDGYGISVPRELQTTKGSISAALAGLESDREGEGYLLATVKAWDYPALVDTYLAITMQVRRTHKPALIHVMECTQPQGHSTSGSHERYKSEERLSWEKDSCCLTRMRSWMLASGLALESELTTIEEQARISVEEARQKAWKRFQEPMQHLCSQAELTLEATRGQLPQGHSSLGILDEALLTLSRARQTTIYRRHIQAALHRAQFALAREPASMRHELDGLLRHMRIDNHRRFNGHLVSDSAASPLRASAVSPRFDSPESQTEVDGRLVLRSCFEQLLKRDPTVFALGEDVGKLGDVNLVFEGLQDAFGPLRVTDTGIREATILGQGIGSALRGLRPLVDIQYLDYLLYALQVMSDDLATTFYRTAGSQKCPVIIRTKGHRLEGIWHTGSPMGMILAALRGLYVCVPRNMTQAAGMYNVLFEGDSPALVIEVLNGYRLKERIPDNVGEFKVPLGVPEILRRGNDLTLVTYGACCRVALEAAALCSQLWGIEIEVIDAQTLIPFDRPGLIVDSLRRTNRLLVVDEDVPGGASAFILQQIVEAAGGFDWLETTPRTLTAQPNRAAYASDGDYFCKPSAENIVEAVYQILRTLHPANFPEMDPATTDLWRTDASSLPNP
jgi:2-oxoisovalerate dehydrogenase E1 component